MHPELTYILVVAIVPERGGEKGIWNLEMPLDSTVTKLRYSNRNISVVP
jgi:hypothetical protein